VLLKAFEERDGDVVSVGDRHCVGYSNEMVLPRH